MNKYIRFKDKSQRKLVVKDRFNKFDLKSLSLRENLSFNLKFKTMLKMQELIAVTRIKKRCINSNYSRALISYTNLSKAEFRKSMGLGLVTGFRKASW